MTREIGAVEQPSFIKKKHELADLLKKLDKVSSGAVDLIVETMNSTDGTVTRKMKLDCALALVDLHTKVADQVSRDELTRQIAEVKANALKVPVGNGGKPGEPTRRAPMKDFTNIQKV